MPEVSIVIKAEDRYSAVLKNLSATVKGFDKDAEHLERTLHALSGEKSVLKAETDRVRKAMQEAQKQFAATHDEADGLAASLAGREYEDYRRKLEAVNRTMEETERQIRNVEGTARKSGGNTGGGAGGLINALATSGIGDMFKQLAQEGANTMVSSAFGDDAGTLFSNALSSAVSGAAIGWQLGGVVGAAAGTAIGGIAGLATGGLQIFEKRDEAFKEYVQDSVEGQLSAQERSLASGSAIAARRETDRISFSTMFGDEAMADQYLSNLVGMANETPFLYDDLMAMSKTLAADGYSAQADSEKTAAGEKDFNYILDVLQTVGDAGTALGQSTGDMNAVATALGRMKSSGLTTWDNLNVLDDHSIGAVGMLADAYHVDQETMNSMISKGEIEGGEAAEIILQAMTDAFGGSMAEQSQTFSGLTSTVEGLGQELDNAMGEGYNEERKSGLEAQRDWLSGESGEAVKEANRAIGAWQAELENEKERYQREAVDAMMDTEEYKAAKEAGDAAEMGRMIMEAKIQGMNEYNASNGAQLALESELALARAVREDAKSDSAYYDAGLRKSQEFTRGLAEGMFKDNPLMNGGTYNPVTDTYEYPDGSSNAFGLRYVPYNGYRAILHQGERVQTAEEARRADRGGGSVAVSFAGANFTVRQEGDIEAIAASIVSRLEERALLYGG